MTKCRPKLDIQKHDDGIIMSVLVKTENYERSGNSQTQVRKGIYRCKKGQEGRLPDQMESKKEKIWKQMQRDEQKCDIFKEIGQN